MGYEVMMLIGKRTLREEPIFERKKNGGLKVKNGRPIETGRTQQWFKIMAMIDMCKIEIPRFKFTKKPEKGEPELFWYPPTGNDESVRVDCYGDVPVIYSVRTVLDVFTDHYASNSVASSYRRYEWAINLLKSMVDDAQGLEVIFFGH